MPIKINNLMWKLKILVKIQVHDLLEAKVCGISQEGESGDIYDWLRSEENELESGCHMLKLH